MLATLTVSQFITQINGIIAGEFIIEGEVSGYKISQGKWVFFDLKDTVSTLSCFSTLFTIRQPLEDGMKVRVFGYPNIHGKSGRFSFTVQRVELVGEGSLKRVYEMLKVKLLAEGLFDPARKRLLVKLPQRIGVIASRDSAAFGDFKKILNNRWGGIQVVLKHVAVQGESAVEEIVRAFKQFNEHSLPFDCIVLIRGGGSLEDLSAFNSEEVARAVYGSIAPVVCGVGHERDESLADFAADVRASTPSNAAERVVPDRTEFATELTFELGSLADALLHVVRMTTKTLDHYKHISGAALQRILVAKKQFIISSGTLLKNVDHRAVLKRGYSITRTPQGNVLKKSSAAKLDELVVTELWDGSIQSRVV